ncbi:MAG: hypothetical protein HC898_12040 [Phycisphaerales bacterium]|nr:hypothetical protein [Phycisphaerales bacterium]
MATGLSLGGSHFSKILALQDAATDRLPQSREELVRQTAEELVSTALVKPLLGQLRNDPFKSELFHGGQAEDAFGEQMDTLLADRMVKGTRLPVVDAVYRTLMERGGKNQGGAINLLHRE